MTRHYPRTLVLIAAILLIGNASSAEQLYSKQPPTTPELATAGSHTVGVTTLTVEDDDQSMRVRGYSGFSLLGRTQIWYRVK